jgi:hypothetical protein
MAFKYRQTVLSELSRHGVKPLEDTPPGLVHDFINDLYRYEIRALRADMLTGAFPKSDYAERVDELRKRYPILSLPVDYWIEDE